MKYINDFIEYLEVIKKCSDYTIDNYEKDIIEFNVFLEDNKYRVDKIDYDIVKKYLLYLYDKKLSRSSISRKLSSLRSFYKYLESEYNISNDYFLDINNPKKEKNLPKFIKDSDLDKMFSSINKDTVLGQRNLLILELLYASGIRVSELVNLKLSDFNLYERSIKILGKGDKERIVYYGSFCEDALDLYLKDSRIELNKHDSNYLLLNKNGNKISERQIRNILNDIILKSSVDMHVSPHMLRHTFATDMLNNGADLVSVKELLGHESLDTTSIYTHITDEKIRKIYDLAHPRAKE